MPIVMFLFLIGTAFHTPLTVQHIFHMLRFIIILLSRLIKKDAPEDAPFYLTYKAKRLVRNLTCPQCSQHAG